MAPRGQSLPQAMTESAREARKSFFCDLCQKGYARMNEFEAHENSYDHLHRKRMKEGRQLIKDPNAAAKARLAEQKQNEESGIKKIDLSSISNSTPAASGKKKPVFKSTLQPQNAAKLEQTSVKPSPDSSMLDGGAVADDPSGAIENGWADDAYDPFAPDGVEDVHAHGIDEICERCRVDELDVPSALADARKYFGEWTPSWLRT